MKFLVIVVCLLINHYWRKDRVLPGDAWFVNYQRWLRENLLRLPENVRQHEVIYPLTILFIPIAIFYGFSWAAAGVLLNFITLGLHVLVLLLAFDRINIVQLTQRYLALWRAGNFEAAYTLIQEQSRDRVEGSFAEYRSLHQKFCDLLIASYLERLFVVMFWYLLLGPAGVLLYAMARLYCLHEGYMHAEKWHEGNDATSLMLRLVYILEWPVARAMGLTFSLAGDFVASFSRLRESFMTDIPALRLVRLCAVAALGSVSVRLHSEIRPAAAADESSAGDIDDIVTGKVEPLDEGFCEWAARQLEELLSLLVRSQVIWVAVLALLAVYGFG